ncbi:MAG: fatty acid desaturase [Candidatus Caenarcaniphilales bacterium]|nr:fatty acid desaturase [Candidatus Caenarcaniphilales bacterium]
MLINNLFFTSFNIQSWVDFLEILFRVCLSAFLYTGLFITAHDAMHGTISPKFKNINSIVGKICVFLYALFDYSALREKHSQHHNNPVTSYDPDFAAGKHFWAWYCVFMQRYLKPAQILKLILLSQIWILLFNISITKLLVFWALPSFLSTLQLFYFGTYLTHKKSPLGYGNPFNTRSLNLPPFLSFLCCYNFCYHVEHHSSPSIPWWKLSKAQ